MNGPSQKSQRTTQYVFSSTPIGCDIWVCIIELKSNLFEEMCKKLKMHFEGGLLLKPVNITVKLTIGEKDKIPNYHLKHVCKLLHNI